MTEGWFVVRAAVGLAHHFTVRANGEARSRCRTVVREPEFLAPATEGRPRCRVCAGCQDRDARREAA